MSCQDPQCTFKLTVNPTCKLTTTGTAFTFASCAAADAGTLFVNGQCIYAALNSSLLCSQRSTGCVYNAAATTVAQATTSSAMSQTTTMMNNGAMTNSCPTGYNYQNGQCINTNQPQAMCIGTGYSFQQGRYFDSRDLFSTQAACVPSCDTNYGGSDSTTIASLTGTSCTSLQYCTQPCPKCQYQSSASGFCYNSALTQQTCTGDGNRFANGICIKTALNVTTCTGTNLAFNDCSLLSSSTCPEHPLVGNTNGDGLSLAQILSSQCQWNSFASCPDKASCLQGGSCDDNEFGNSQSDGACVYTPVSIRSCGVDKSTRDGRCISSQRNTLARCVATGDSWILRSKSQAACLSIGTCQLRTGRENFFNKTQCEGCNGGIYKTTYRWQTAQWINRTILPVAWKPYEWVNVNNYSDKLDLLAVQQVIQNAASASLLNSVLADFNKQVGAFLPLMVRMAYFCGIGDAGQAAVTYPSTCDTSASCTNNGFTTPAGSFQVSVISSNTSSAPNTAGGTGDQPPAGKIVLNDRRLKIGNSVSAYTVIYSYGYLVGQLVGSVYTVTYGAVPSSAVAVCVTPDSTIVQDAVTYPVMDFATR